MKYPNMDFDSAHGVVQTGTLQISDELLMKHLSQKKPEALQDLYHRYHGLLRSVILRVIHNPAEAEDVLQEVYLEVWKRADSYCETKGKPLGWLITLARRRAIDRIRHLTAYRGATDRYEVECKHLQAAHEHHAEEDTVSREDMRSYLVSLLERLPDNQRVVVEKAYFDGWSQRQIASNMDIPLGTVKTRIELGLRKLSNVMNASRARIE
jgi:RNA polymerase sigma-70 factor (ECF subfamily)